MFYVFLFFVFQFYVLGGFGDVEVSLDEEEEIFKFKVEYMIMLVGDVKGCLVFIVDDMIDKFGLWIVVVEMVWKCGKVEKVYCIVIYGVFGGDCFEQMQVCDCIDIIVVINSYLIFEEKVCKVSKLVVFDLLFFLVEVICRNYYGELMLLLFQYVLDL